MTEPTAHIDPTKGRVCPYKSTILVCLEIWCYDCQIYIDLENNLPEDYLTCPHCGFNGPEVNYHNEYIGGQGYVRIIQCDDRLACWKRWDIEHRLKTPDWRKASLELNRRN